MASSSEPLAGGNRTPSTNSTWDAELNSLEHTIPLRHRLDSSDRIPNQAEEDAASPQDSAFMQAGSEPGIVLLSSGDRLLSGLEQALGSSPLRIQRLTSWREAARQLADCRLPNVIFTDVRLSDGDWKQVIHWARRVPVPVEVIVVSRIVDVRLYLDAIELGAFDFVVPPFRTSDLWYIIANAFYACQDPGRHGLPDKLPVSLAANPAVAADARPMRQPKDSGYQQ